MSELGVAMLYPNVRGSTGYGKRFVTLDDGYKREDSVKVRCPARFLRHMSMRVPD